MHKNKGRNNRELAQEFFTKKIIGYIHKIFLFCNFCIKKYDISVKLVAEVTK
jgi:hypothetical protein